jgi:hypothetical protein
MPGAASKTADGVPDVLRRPSEERNRLPEQFLTVTAPDAAPYESTSQLGAQRRRGTVVTRSE